MSSQRSNWRERLHANPSRMEQALAIKLQDRGIFYFSQRFSWDTYCGPDGLSTCTTLVGLVLGAQTLPMLKSLSGLLKSPPAALAQEDRTGEERKPSRRSQQQGSESATDPFLVVSTKHPPIETYFTHRVVPRMVQDTAPHWLSLSTRKPTYSNSNRGEGRPH